MHTDVGYMWLFRMIADDRETEEYARISAPSSLRTCLRLPRVDGKSVRVPGPDIRLLIISCSRIVYA